MLVAGSSSSPPAAGHGAAPGHAAATQPAHAPAVPGAAHAKPATRAASEAHSATPSSAPADNVTAEEALKLLQEGNTRYVTGKTARPHADGLRRDQTAKAGQKPFVTIVSCSDSRVPVEIVFDCGIGDLFVIRVAGNVCDVDEIGTAEYGTEHLGTPLLVVLGHTRCGAVTAVATGAHLHGNISKLVDNIGPAIETVRKAHPDLNAESLVPAAIEANVRTAIADLLTNSEIVRGLVKSGKLRIEGGVYDLTSGKVDWLGPHPKQTELIAKAEEAGNPHDAEHSAPPATAHKPAQTATSRPHAAVAATRPAHSVAAAPAHTVGPLKNGASASSTPPGGTAKPPASPIADPMNTSRPEPAAPTAEDEHASRRINPAGAPATPVVDNEQVLGARPPGTSLEAQSTSRPAINVPGLLERHTAEELYRQGLSHLANEQYTAAAERFGAAVRMDPSLTAAVIDLAGVHYLQRNYGKAAELYHSVLSSDPNNVLAIRGAALVSASRKQYPQARDMLKRLLARNNKDAQTWLDLGDVALLMGEPTAAREHWSKATEVDPNATTVIRNARRRLQAYSAP